MTNKTQATELKWVSYPKDSLEAQVGQYGYYVGKFGTNKVNNKELIGWYDRLYIDGRRLSRGEVEEQWLYEFVEVQVELIRRYFILHNLPKHIADELTDGYEWSEKRIAEFVKELRRFI